MELTDDPDECWYKHSGLSGSCPLEELGRYPGVADRIRFSMIAIESWTKTDQHTKIETVKYSVSPERLQLALKLFGVPLRPGDPPSEMVDFQNGLHALEVCNTASQAMEDAPNRTLVQARERRRQKALDERHGRN